MTKYIFGLNINKTGNDGIIDVESHKVLCICPEENAKIILEAIEKTNYQDKCKGCGTSINQSYYCDHCNKLWES